MNRFQRWYFAWAEPHYRKLTPETRAEVERIDRYLYSRRGLRAWGAMAAAAVLSAVALHAVGAAPLLAAAVSVIAWGSLPLAMLAAWLQPDRFRGRKGLRMVLLTLAGLYAGALAGFLSGRAGRGADFAPAALLPALGDAFFLTLPYLAVALAAMTVALRTVAFVRRRILEAELSRSRLVQERDTAARQAAEARLRLLQGQIRPHFVFNTLASLQHWVDTGDARAGPLLRSLTAFLRQATEAMDRPTTDLGAECDRAGHYLSIMRTRLGDRLRGTVEIAEPGLRAIELPSGLLLTLVENAVEHGVEPQLAGGTVEVRVGRERGDAGDRVVVAVRDDGAGLAPDAVDGVGIGNSRDRLRHLFGDRATLEIRPGPARVGTLAELRIALDPAAP